MQHKFTTAPSLGWLYKFFKPYFEKWAVFELKDVGYWKGILEEEGFDLTQPIRVRGILNDIRKRPSDPNAAFWSLVPCRDCLINLGFKKVCFIQGDKELQDPFRRLSRCRYLISNVS